MDGPRIYRLEALDFYMGVIADLELQLRAMPKDLLIVRVPASMPTSEMRELHGKVEKLMGLEVLVLDEAIEFLRLVEVPASVEGSGLTAGRSVRLVGD